MFFYFIKIWYDENMKRIITVQDISCIGKCSLTVALPIISAMGVEACVLPTAVLSTHTAFKGFTFRDLTQDISKIADHWKSEKIHFDAIYTGYLGSIEQIDLISQLIADFGGKDTLTVVDPCMADNGKLYAGFTEDFSDAMKKLCSKADVILPNMTEACFLLGLPYKASGYNQEYIQNILKKLSELGATRIILKGIDFNQGKIGIASYDSITDSFGWYFHEKVGTNFHGTGDIFASVMTGALMRDMTLEDSYKLAADFVVDAIKNTLSRKDYNWYGVDFEKSLGSLITKLPK